MTAYHINDEIEIIDEAIKGKIVSMNRDRFRILTKEGYEMEVHRREVMKIKEPSMLKITHTEVSRALEDKAKGLKAKKHKVKFRKQAILPMEVDLHIHHLVDSTKGMTNYDMLSLQLTTAKNTLDFAIKNNIKKIVFIHGVGEGVLKVELGNLFKKYKNITYYDADFKKYGFGATEVFIYQNY